MGARAIVLAPFFGVEQYGLMSQQRQTAWVLVLIIAVYSCAKTGTELDPSQLRQAGPYAVMAVDPVVVYDAVQNRDVSLRVTYPIGAGPFPVIVFSHGAFCYPQLYAEITDHWVSHGYIVILPNHLDSPNNGKLSPGALQSLMSSRIRDMSFVLDALDRIEAQVRDLRGKTDREHMAVAGHSFGGMIAMIKSGLTLENPEDGIQGDYSDDRFDATVVLSGVGPTAMLDGTVLAESAFSELTGPLFASGGTNDEGNVGTRETFPWQWRMSGYRLAPPGDKYYLVLKDADHYLGGLLCRDNRGGEPDPEAVEIVRMANTAFLNAYLKGDAAAKRFLRDTDFTALKSGRVQFEYK
jgi:dienelactone hydrolase